MNTSIWKKLLLNYEKINDKKTREQIVQVFATTLQNDRQKMLSNCDSCNTCNNCNAKDCNAKACNVKAKDAKVSLCAKYAPKERGYWDKNYNLAHLIADEMGINLKIYRKYFISPLKEHLKIVERLMCQGRWSEINYDKVSSKCLLRNQNTFFYNDPVRFSNFLKRLKCLPDKHYKYISPCQIIENNYFEELSEKFWNCLKKDTKNELESKGLSSPLIPFIVDASNKDTCAMALLLSHILPTPFSNQILFEKDGKIDLCFIGSSMCLEKQMQYLSLHCNESENAHENENTKGNAHKAKKFVTDKCREFQIPENKIPKVVLVFDGNYFLDKE